MDVDDQSEDGEIAEERIPSHVHSDLSNVSSEGDNNDSLDIKPPQHHSNKEKHRKEKLKDKSHRKERKEKKNRKNVASLKTTHHRIHIRDDRIREYYKHYREYRDNSRHRQHDRHWDNNELEDLRDKLIREQKEYDSSQWELHSKRERKDDYSREISEKEKRRERFLQAERERKKLKEQSKKELEDRRKKRELERKKEKSNRMQKITASFPNSEDQNFLKSAASQVPQENDAAMDIINKGVILSAIKKKLHGAENVHVVEIDEASEVEEEDESRITSADSSIMSGDSEMRSEKDEDEEEEEEEVDENKNTSSSDSCHDSSIESNGDEQKKNGFPEVEKVSLSQDVQDEQIPETSLSVEEQLPAFYPGLQGCRSVEEFHCLNKIEEGAYGVVYRGRDKRTNEIVALKRLKMEQEREGFPITSLREINTLLKAQHPNIVTVREIVVGSNLDKIYVVMDYIEHDLKSLMEVMKEKKTHFVHSEVKTLMLQLLQAVAHLHDNWILHRDLKTSNLLLSHHGILKVGDFGLAREYGSPLRQYTPVVVTLWYRAPELLLGQEQYSTPIDMWSVGCIFGELLLMNPLFPGKSEIEQLNKVFMDLGTPNEKIWPGYGRLPKTKSIKFTDYPYNKLRNRFADNKLTDSGFDLINRFLTYNPSRRITAEDALKHDWFVEKPLPKDPSMFPTFPAKSEMIKGHRKHVHSPKAPSGGRQYKQLKDTDDEISFHLNNVDQKISGFSLKF